MWANGSRKGRSLLIMGMVERKAVAVYMYMAEETWPVTTA